MHTKLALVRQNNTLDFAQFVLMKSIDLADRLNEMNTICQRLVDSGKLPKNDKDVKEFIKAAQKWKKWAGEPEYVLERWSKASSSLRAVRPLQVEIDGKMENMLDHDDEMRALTERIDQYTFNYDQKNNREDSEDE